MFNKTIFKQTLKSNYKLWLVFTGILCTLSCIIIATYNPQAMNEMLTVLQDTMGDALAGRLEGATSLLGMLGNNFYGMIACLLPLIYIIITANNLVASQVDRGSMAYTLSTPIKRAKVVGTQAIYLLLSIVAMVGTMIIVGLLSVQLFHGGIVGEVYTDDVKAVAEVLEMDNEEVADDLNIILSSDKALKTGAKERGIEKDVYVAYLNLKLTDEAYQKSADTLGVDIEDIKDDLGKIVDDKKALKAGAKVMDMTEDEYQAMLEATIAQQKNSEQAQAMQSSLVAGLTEAATVLDVDVSELSSDLGMLKNNSKAMKVAIETSGLPEEIFTASINKQLADKELTFDKGTDFSVNDYLLINLGLLLLLFAISSISFASSCIFNLTKYSFTFGAGIPFVFFIFKIMSEVGTDLEKFKYLSLNSLFNPSNILAGEDFVAQFIALGVIGIVFYTLGLLWFKKKDLPL